MKKIYSLSTCNTCSRIIKELNLPKEVEIRDIKKEPLTGEDLEYLKALSGSYAALFNRRARLYREKELHNTELSEKDYKSLLLEHYTFLKRPVLVYDGEIFIGNSKKNSTAAKNALHV